MKRYNGGMALSIRQIHNSTGKYSFLKRPIAAKIAPQSVQMLKKTNPKTGAAILASPVMPNVTKTPPINPISGAIMEMVPRSGKFFFEIKSFIFVICLTLNGPPIGKVG